MIKKSFVVLSIILASVSLKSQEIIDQIIATVGSEIVLKSDIENQFIQIQGQGYYAETGDLKCDILEELMFQKLLKVSPLAFDNRILPNLLHDFRVLMRTRVGASNLLQQHPQGLVLGHRLIPGE